MGSVMECVIRFNQLILLIVNIFVAVSSLRDGTLEHTHTHCSGRRPPLVT